MLSSNQKISFEKRSYGNINHPCIIILAGWMTDQWHYILPAMLLAKKGFFITVISYDKAILSPNIQKTVENFKYIKNETEIVISDLKMKTNIAPILFGISLGSAIACMVAKDDKNIHKVIINLSGADLAEIIWSWDSVNKDFKRSILGQHVLLTALKKAWFHISPANNINNFKNKSVLQFTEENDEIIPYGQQFLLQQALERTACNLKIIRTKRTNHVISAAMNLFDHDHLLDFLKQPDS